MSLPLEILTDHTFIKATWLKEVVRLRIVLQYDGIYIDGPNKFDFYYLINGFRRQIKAQEHTTALELSYELHCIPSTYDGSCNRCTYKLDVFYCCCGVMHCRSCADRINHLTAELIF